MFCLLLYNLGIRVLMRVSLILEGWIRGSCCIVTGSLLGLLVLFTVFVGIIYRVIVLCIGVSVCFYTIG